MSVPENAILKVVASLIWDDGEINQNVYNAVVSGGTPPYDELDVVDDAVEWLETMYANLVSTMATTIDSSHVTVYIWDTVDQDWDEVGQETWALTTTGVDDELPRGVAALVNAKSLDPDISGGKYMPGFIEGSSTDGLWAVSVITALAAYAADWIAGFVGVGSGADWLPVVWSVKDSLTQAFSGTILIPSIPAYQRRRKNNVGI